MATFSAVTPMWMLLKASVKPSVIIMSFSSQLPNWPKEKMIKKDVRNFEDGFLCNYFSGTVKKFLRNERPELPCGLLAKG